MRLRPCVRFPAQARCSFNVPSNTLICAREGSAVSLISRCKRSSMYLASEFRLNLSPSCAFSMSTTSSLRALLVEKLSLPEAATCAAVFSSVAKCLRLRPDLSLFPPLVSVPEAHQLALCAPSAFPHAHFALAQLPRSLGSLSSKSETSDMYSSSLKSSVLCRWSSRCIIWRSHELGASQSARASGLPMRSDIAHSLD